VILYLDASALIRLYVAEPGSGPIRQAVKNASAVYTVDASYLEVRAALAEGARLGLLTDKAAKKAREDFEVDWQRINAVVPDPALLRLAGDLAELQGVAASVALHLAAMQKIRDQLGSTSMRFMGTQRTMALVSKLAIAATEG
jgi:predicted nucleic acid-binding protein